MSTGTDGIPNQGLSGWGSNKHQGTNGLSKETNLQPRKCVHNVYLDYVQVSEELVNPYACVKNNYFLLITTMFTINNFPVDGGAP